MELHLRNIVAGAAVAAAVLSFMTPAIQPILSAVAETVPIAASVFVFAMLGAVPAEAGLVGLALAGAMLGFAPFNRPVAKLFLGDVGSLPIGLLLGWLLLLVAAGGHLVAALLLPLYYLAAATITIGLRNLAAWSAASMSVRPSLKPSM